MFIATINPLGAGLSQTIGHSIKALLSKAGMNTNQFTAYSTWHATVSNALQQGVGFATIRRNARWARTSQAYFKFHNKLIQAPNITLRGQFRSNFKFFNVLISCSQK